MKRKLLVACIAFGAIPTVPSLAPAKPVLTHPTGTVLAPGAFLVGTNVSNPTMTTPSGSLQCSSAVTTGKVHSNSTASGFELEIMSVALAGTGAKQAGEPDNECTGFLTPSYTVTNLPWCLEATKAEDKFEMRGGGCTAAAKPFTLTLVGTLFGFPITCKYSRAAGSPIVGTFTTHPGDAVAVVTGEPVFTRTESSESCFSAFKLDAGFTFETDESTAAPIYASQ